jgi:Flp pilus assembly protein TadB
MMMEKFYRKSRILYPNKYFAWLKSNLEYAGMETETERFATLAFLYSFSISMLICSILLITGVGYASLFAFIGIPVLLVLFHMYVILIGDQRGNFAESVLPDALQLMSANIRSGLTPDKALLFAARPEFGILEKEIKFAASKAVAGEPLEDALTSLGNRIKSRIINRTFTLIVEGMRKGGEIATLLEKTSEDIRDLKILKKEVSAQVGMYVIFIFISIGFAAPLLFAFSAHLVQTMGTIGKGLSTGDTSDYAVIGSIKFGVLQIPDNFLRNYTIATLAITAFFGSLLLGLLQDGKEKAGIKYIPILLILNISIYLLARIVLASIFGSIAPATTSLI